jgi:hypothetical protein
MNRNYLIRTKQPQFNIVRREIACRNSYLPFKVHLHVRIENAKHVDVGEACFMRSHTRMKQASRTFSQLTPSDTLSKSRNICDWNSNEKGERKASVNVYENHAVRVQRTTFVTNGKKDTAFLFPDVAKRLIATWRKCNDGKLTNYSVAKTDFKISN